MSQSRPENNIPKVVFDWFRTVKNNDAIHCLLKEFRQTGYSENLNKYDPYHVILHALTTNDLNEIDVERLKAAKEYLTTLPIDDIIKLINLVLELIIKIIEASKMCKKPIDRDRAKLEFVEMLKSASDDNPFINLPYIHLYAADLKEVNLKYANLENAKLKFVQLDHSNLKHANLRGATLYQSDIRGADISQADLRWADLTHCQSDIKSDKLDLKTFLQTRCNKDICLQQIPTVDELNAALTAIQTELESEKLGSHERKMTRRLNQHTYHEQVAMNVARLSPQIKDAEQGYKLMMAGVNHPYFTHHATARFAKHLDHVIVSAHKLFHHHVRQTPYVGSGSQCVMLQAAKNFEDCMHKAERTPRPATP